MGRLRHAAPLASMAALVALVACVMSPLARADELDRGGAAAGFVIHDAAETLARYCERDSAGTLWLALPDGARYELVTSVSDPAIANHGDGSFHPFDAAEVRAALAGVRYPLQGVSAEVFLLPYPRRGAMTSAGGAHRILLSPGVWPLDPERQHAEFTHELGHVVHRALLVDESG